LARIVDPVQRYRQSLMEITRGDFPDSLLDSIGCKQRDLCHIARQEQQTWGSRPWLRPTKSNRS
jgi:hypothetical protein